MFGHERARQGWASACGRNQERSAGAHASQGVNNQRHRRTFTVSGFAQSKPNSRGRKVQNTFFVLFLGCFVGFFLSFAGGGTPSSCRDRVLLGPPPPALPGPLDTAHPGTTRAQGWAGAGTVGTGRCLHLAQHQGAARRAGGPRGALPRAALRQEGDTEAAAEAGREGGQVTALIQPETCSPSRQ